MGSTSMKEVSQRCSVSLFNKDWSFALPCCCSAPSQAGTRENVGLYGTGFLFEEPNPTGSRPRDLTGLYRQQKKPHPPHASKVPLRLPRLVGILVERMHKRETWVYIKKTARRHNKGVGAIQVTMKRQRWFVLNYHEATQTREVKSK